MVFASGWIYLGIKTSYCTVVFVNETDSSVVEKMLEHLVLHWQNHWASTNIAVKNNNWYQTQTNMESQVSFFTADQAGSTDEMNRISLSKFYKPNITFTDAFISVLQYHSDSVSCIYWRLKNDGLFIALFLNWYLLFWNQFLIWSSVMYRIFDKRARSLRVRYIWRENTSSK